MKSFFKSRFSVANYKLYDLIIIALFIALEVIFDRFLSINQWNIKIGIGFLPAAIIAYRYGATGAIRLNYHAPSRRFYRAGTGNPNKRYGWESSGQQSVIELPERDGNPF